jgi:hypothetical protein
MASPLNKEKSIFGNKHFSRYHIPKKCTEINERFLKYKNASELSKAITVEKNDRVHVIVDGSFYFGDFIEAFIVDRNLHVKEMTISTLSMNQNNVDSLQNLIKGNFVDSLNLIVSDYFFSHEKYELIPYIYKALDKNDSFQLSSCSTHCKICIFETHNGDFYVFHGSANLRSSSNIEQICLENNKELYLFHKSIQDSIINEYKSINKSVRSSRLWQVVATEKDGNQDCNNGEELERGKEPQSEQPHNKKQGLRSKKF